VSVVYIHEPIIVLSNVVAIEWDMDDHDTNKEGGVE